MTASVIGFDRSSSASSLHAASQRSIHLGDAEGARGPLGRYTLMGGTSAAPRSTFSCQILEQVRAVIRPAN